MSKDNKSVRAFFCGSCYDHNVSKTFGDMFISVGINLCPMPDLCSANTSALTTNNIAHSCNTDAVRPYTWNSINDVNCSGGIMIFTGDDIHKPKDQFSKWIALTMRYTYNRLFIIGIDFIDKSFIGDPNDFDFRVFISKQEVDTKKREINALIQCYHELLASL